jgi:hypothetical protein
MKSRVMNGVNRPALCSALPGYPADHEIQVPQEDGSSRKARSLKTRSRKGRGKESATPTPTISIVEAVFVGSTAHWVSVFGWKSLGSVRGFGEALLAVSFASLFAYVMVNGDRWLSSLRKRSRGTLKQRRKR